MLQRGKSPVNIVAEEEVPRFWRHAIVLENADEGVDVTVQIADNDAGRWYIPEQSWFAFESLPAKALALVTRGINTLSV